MQRTFQSVGVGTVDALAEGVRGNHREVDVTSTGLQGTTRIPTPARGRNTRTYRSHRATGSPSHATS